MTAARERKRKRRDERRQRRDREGMRGGGCAVSTTGLGDGSTEGSQEYSCKKEKGRKEK
jgi:hypothetical protein